ncbi:MAG: type II secretion system minor pseudopilin GspI, partial [Alcanivoracaceae bacterium]
MTRKSGPQTGFTLIEVLVAISVMALLMAGIANTVGSSANGYGRVNEKFLAWMVASDKLVELQVYNQFPATGTQDSTVERFDRRWRVRTTVTEGPYPDTRRVDISVGPEAGFGEDARVVLEQATLVG